MTALHILHITRADSLPAWFTEAEAQLQAIAADLKCEAVVLDTTPSVEVAPWDVIPDAWLIGDDVVFGSKEWFAAIPEREF